MKRKGNNAKVEPEGWLSSSAENREMVVIIAILLSFVVFANSILYFSLSERQQGILIHGFATGVVRFCINSPPEFNVNCSQYSYPGIQYYCSANATDADGHAISYYSNGSLFNISSAGVVNFTPIGADVGAHPLFIRAVDNSTCTNTNSTYLLNLSVCVEPSWDNFRNNLTTNLTVLPCWNNVVNFTIGRTGSGQIKLNGSFGIDGYDFDSYLNITRNSIRINTSHFPSLNSSAELAYYNLSLDPTQGIAVYRDGSICNAPDCIILNHTSQNATIFVNWLNGHYQVVEMLNISVSDTTDYFVRYVKEPVFFYANLTLTNGIPVSDASCNINVSGRNATEGFQGMTYNQSTRLYQYNRTLPMPGNYTYNITCTRLVETYGAGIASITNRNPIFTINIPDLTWNQGQTITGLDLDDYVLEPDNESITFFHTAVESIVITINSITHVLTLQPQPSFFGNRSVIFYAFDESGGVGTSNVVNLLVIEVVGSYSPPPTIGGGGGGSGGAGGLPPPACAEDWDCTEWSECLPSGIQYRECVQKSLRCNTTVNKPQLSRQCNYFPTCFDGLKNGQETGVDCGGPVCGKCTSCHDGIQNQGEEGIDCGGPCGRCSSCFDGLKNGNENGIDCGGGCAACPTCFDGIQNQGEEQIDCGGPACNLCPTCSDRLQNQGEEGIDCGGPCNPCSGLEFFAPVQKSAFGTFILLLLLLLVIYLLRRKQINSLIVKFIWVPLISLFKRKKSHEDYIRLIRKAVSKLESLQSRIGKTENRLLFENIVAVVTGTMKEVFMVDATANIDDLEKKIGKKLMNPRLVSRLASYLDNLSEYRFSEKGMAKNELADIIHKSIAMLEDVLIPACEEVLLYTDDINSLIKQLKHALGKKDYNYGLKVYKKTIERYKQLEETEKKKYYSVLGSLGQELRGRLHK